MACGILSDGVGVCLRAPLNLILEVEFSFVAKTSQHIQIGNQFSPVDLFPAPLVKYRCLSTKSTSHIVEIGTESRHSSGATDTEWFNTVLANYLGFIDVLI